MGRTKRISKARRKSFCETAKKARARRTTAKGWKSIALERDARSVIGHPAPLPARVSQHHVGALSFRRNQKVLGHRSGRIAPSERQFTCSKCLTQSQCNRRQAPVQLLGWKAAGCSSRQIASAAPRETAETWTPTRIGYPADTTRRTI